MVGTLVVTCTSLQLSTQSTWNFCVATPKKQSDAGQQQAIGITQWYDEQVRLIYPVRPSSVECVIYDLTAC
jgi:hypothetical protein